VFVVGENLFAQLIDELIETQIDFSFDFVVQKLFAENGQRIVSRIVIEIKGEKYAPVNTNQTSNFKFNRKIAFRV
jgi:hypothetical protein